MRLANQVIEALRRVEIDCLSCKTTMPQMDRALYVQVNKALECMGGKWSRAAKAHVWDCDPNEPIASAIVTGEIRDWKKELQFFPTPPDLAWKIALLAEVKPGHRVLEPSAGKGALILAVRNATQQSPEVHITAVEINETMVDLLAYAQAVHFGDFLACNGQLGTFDRIVMNPPFTRGQDIAHVRHAFEMLRPGGRLVAVTAPGWEFRNDRKHLEFREWFRDQDAALEDIPEGTFAESGTMIRTKLVLINKE